MNKLQYYRVCSCDKRIIIVTKVYASPTKMIEQSSRILLYKINSMGYG